LLNLLTRRIVATLVTLSLISVVAFILIQLPPGDYVDAYVGKKTQGGVIITQEELDVMRTRLGLDKQSTVTGVFWNDNIAHSYVTEHSQSKPIALYADCEMMAASKIDQLKYGHYILPDR
jgi:ABC-type dipeptide/oligopeptide/nickel transport system permease component